jgi:hypothetical protein
MPLVSKATATTTLKSGKVKVKAGYKEVETKTGKKMYFSVKKEEKPKEKSKEKPKEEKEKVEKKPRKPRKKKQSVLKVEENPDELEFD